MLRDDLSNANAYLGWDGALVRRIFTLLILVASAACPAAAEPVDFEAEIEPIFAKRCIECHGPKKQKGKFRLDRLAPLLRGGGSGEAAIVPGEPTNSFLVKLIKHEEEEPGSSE